MKNLYLVLALSLCVFVSGCLPDTRESRDTIFTYVYDNYKQLESFPYNELIKFGRWDDGYETFIREYLGNDTIVKSIDAYSEDIIDFYCGGWGLSVGSFYTGFYFSSNDTPTVFEFGDGSELDEIETGVFYWQDETRSTRNIRTEKIRDNWYYYIMEWR